MHEVAHLYGKSLAQRIQAIFAQEGLDVHLSLGKTVAAVAAATLEDHSGYLAGDVWNSVSTQLIAIRESSDAEDCLTRLSLIVNILRGRQCWSAAKQCLDFVALHDPGILSRTTQGHLLAARCFLDFERNRLKSAKDCGVKALPLLARSARNNELDSRVLVSLLWKLSHVEKARRHVVDARKHLERARALSTEGTDLHGYCNLELVEAHQALADNRFFDSIEAILRVVHPPHAFRAAAPSSFIPAEAARAIALLEVRFLQRHGRYLGLANPFAVLEYSEAVFDETTSKVMRIPYLGTLAIASPTMLAEEIRLRYLGIPLPDGRFRPTDRERAMIYARYNGLCSVCGRKILSDSGSDGFDVDHIIFHKWGMQSRAYSKPDLLNYRPLHPHCNKRRGARASLSVSKRAFEVLSRGVFNGLFLGGDSATRRDSERKSTAATSSRS